MTNEEAISRQAAIDALESSKDKTAKGDIGGFYNTIIQNNINKLKKLPSVIIQPKTGHWIYTLEDWNRWECSECGYTKRTDVHVKIGYKYCPNCGAKMTNAESASEIS